MTTLYDGSAGADVLDLLAAGGSENQTFHSGRASCTFTALSLEPAIPGSKDRDAAAIVRYADAGGHGGVPMTFYHKAAAGGANSFFSLTLPVTTVDVTQLCFAAGTCILTMRGEVAVEALTQDDLVVGMHSGKLVPIHRIGRCELALRGRPDRDAIDPVIVCAGALGPGQPHRDLVLSPHQVLHVDGQAIAVRHLLNGATIRQERWDEISYYQVELEAHDVLLANGMTAESFRSSGVRAPGTPNDETLAALRRTLLGRAASLGHSTRTDPSLRVMAGDRILQPKPVAGGLRFQLPKNTGSVRIISRTFVPHEIRAAGPDCRRLGVGVTGIRLDGRVVELSGDRLGEGWHPAEAGLRWTAGEAWLRTGIARSLVLSLLDDAIYWADGTTEMEPHMRGAETARCDAARTPEDIPPPLAARARGGASSSVARACSALVSALISLPFKTIHNV